ncbi:MAG: phenylalanine--tRNA ligase subunit beta [Dehalococcoidia bacterium]
MRVPLKWLREYVDVTLPPDQLARRLTLSSTEVEEVIRLGGWDAKVRVGEVLRVEPHPNADRLRLATVTTGDRTQTVVCGAPNVAAGQKVAFGEEGAVLTNGHTGERMTLKPTKIRGVESAGMVLSERELGISENHEGILELPADAPVGLPLSEYLGDVVLDLSTWANRPDLLSVLGIAREVAALTNQRVREPSTDYPESGTPAAERIAVEIDDPDLCSRYVAAVVEGVTIGPSPQWMQDRLVAAGQRPINNIVDITNYVMLEFGQPLHAFDYDHVRGRRIVVRRPRPGERLVTIDGLERELDPEMLMIADAERVVAVAGVMGGSDSEVSDGTTTVLLEAANFNGPSVRRTAQRLKMRTEASLRFEKGLSAQLPLIAARRAVQLMVELAGGRAAPGVVDAYPAPDQPVHVVVPAARMRQVLGIDIPPSRVRDVLTALGFRTDWVPPDRYSVHVPYWRTDVRIPDDVSEEVIRIVGYDDLPNTTISGRVPVPIDQPLRDLRERVKDILAAAGMQEVMTYSLVTIEQLQKVTPPEDLAVSPPLKVRNPITVDHEYLRTTLRGSLLETLELNLRRSNRAEVSLFETARSYQPSDDGLPDEEETVTGVIAGRRADRWGLPGEAALDFFDAKGYVEALFEGLGIRASFEPSDEFGFVPGRCAAVVAGGVQAGVFGQVHPNVLDAFGIEQDAYQFEIRLSPLVPLAGERAHYQDVSRYEAVRRDLALVVDVGVTAASLQAAIAATPRLVSVRPFDEYRGAPLPSGKKSLAFALSFQAPDRTLTDEEVDKAIDRLLRQVERQFGAVRR